MKLLAVVLLSCLTSASTAVAQSERPLGFAEILWKTKSAEVKKRMLEKEGIKVVEENSGRLTLHGGTFAGKQATYWGLDFVEGEFYRGAVILKTIEDRDKEFEGMKASLTEKYGRPTTTSKKGKDLRIIWRFAPDSRNRDKEYIELWNNLGAEGMKITYRNESMNTGKPEESL